jgi:hypothetical protein
LAFLPLHPVQALKTLFGVGSTQRIRSPEQDDGGIGPHADGSLSQMRYQEYMKLATERIAMYKEFELMDESDIPAVVNDLYAANATLLNLSNGRSIWITSKNKKIEDLGMELLDCVEAEDNVCGMARNTAMYGSNFEAILQERRGDGSPGKVVGLEAVDPKEIWIVKEQSGSIKGYSRGPVPNSGGESGQRLALPWEYLHLRLLGKDRSSEYGYSIHAATRQAYRRLKLMEDSMVIYRMRRTPDRFAFGFKGGSGMTLAQKVKYLNVYRQLMRKKTGVENTQEGAGGGMRSEMNPISLDEDFYYFEDDVSITRLTGTEKVDHVLDIDYARKRLLGLYHVPADYLGFEDAKGGGLNNESPLSVLDMEFARIVRRIQRAIMTGFARLHMINLAWQGIDPFSPENEFFVHMEPASYLEEQYKSQVTKTRAEVIKTMKSIGNDLKVDEKKWTEFVFKLSGFPQEFLHTDDDEGEPVKLTGKVPLISALSADNVHRIEEALESGDLKQLVEATNVHKGIRELADMTSIGLGASPVMGSRGRFWHSDEFPVEESLAKVETQKSLVEEGVEDV